MTRQEIENSYANAFGNIVSPGKYEGEPIWAPYFHDATIDGCAEELSFMEDGCGEYVALVEISDEDRAEFPELGTSRYVLVCETDQGFVSVQEVETEEQAGKLRDAYEPENDEDDEDDGMNCNCCEALMINGVFSHETGCPNAGKTWVSDREDWVRFVECRECGFEVEVGSSCSCCEENE